MPRFTLAHGIGLSLCLSLGFSLKAIALESADSLIGKQYTTLPASLCEGVAENLLGNIGTQEYSGVICESKTNVHFFLQKLVNYTATGKAVWQIVDVQAIPVPNATELAVNVGCFSQLDRTIPVFARVQDSETQPYTTLQAWQANLQTERFEEINPKVVSCYNPLLGDLSSHQSNGVERSSEPRSLGSPCRLSQ